MNSVCIENIAWAIRKGSELADVRSIISDTKHKCEDHNDNNACKKISTLRVDEEILSDNLKQFIGNMRETCK